MTHGKQNSISTSYFNFHQYLIILLDVSVTKRTLSITDDSLPEVKKDLLFMVGHFYESETVLQCRNKAILLGSTIGAQCTNADSIFNAIFATFAYLKLNLEDGKEETSSIQAPMGSLNYI